MGAFVIIIIVVLIWYFGFHKKRKTPEERQAEQEKVRDSAVTQGLCNWIYSEFSNMQGEKVYNLRHGNGYRLDVFRNGIRLTLFNKKGEEMDKEGVTFAGLGYEDLPNGDMVSALSNELIKTLSGIPHLRVSGNHIFGGTGIKQSW